MMSYAAYAVCHDWGCRPAQFVFTKEEGIILAAHVYFLVGTDEATDNGASARIMEMCTKQT
jgi:hypothetical protein